MAANQIEDIFHRVAATPPPRRAPTWVAGSLTTSCTTVASKFSLLLRSSLRAWFLVSAASEHDQDISRLFNELNHEGVTNLALRLDSWTHQGWSASFNHVFYAAQRAKSRQDILISHGLSSLIGSDNTRPSKRSRPNDIDDDDHSPVNSPSSNTSPLGACETAPPNLAYQSPNTANVTNNDTPPRWPKASVLRAFPVRVSDGVIRKTMATETYASITVSYGKDPTKAFLVLNVTRKLATILAQELFGKQIRYHEEEAKWVLEMSDGMEIVINGQISFERARVEPIETLFGLLISTAFQNNPKRMDELANGHSLTRLLTLSLDSRRDRTDQVRIALDAVMLSGLECQLWEKYPKQQF